MTTLCPNCSRPARKGATYCGYCGTNLTAPRNGGQFTQASDSVARGSKGQKQAKLKKRDVGRTMAIISLVLLVLIISGALLVQNWVDVLSFVISSIFKLVGS